MRARGMLVSPRSIPCLGAPRPRPHAAAVRRLHVRALRALLLLSAQYHYQESGAESVVVTGSSRGSTPDTCGGRRAPRASRPRSAGSAPRRSEAAWRRGARRACCRRVVAVSPPTPWPACRMAKGAKGAIERRKTNGLRTSGRPPPTYARSASPTSCPAVAGARSPLMTALAGGSMLRSAWLSRRPPPRRRASPATARSGNGLTAYRADSE